MLHRLLPAGICLCCVFAATGQIRFKDMIFNDVIIEKNIPYLDSVPANVKKKRYKLDIYQPENDTSVMRPLILWMHGGGFKFGNKCSRGIPIWSKNFAKRGYVCAAVNYRRSKKNTLSNFTELTAACYRAVEDIQQAIRYLKDHHALYRIDTSRIILAGNSAGGMIALQTGYSSYKTLAAMAHLPNKEIPETPHISAIINFWGGIYDTAWLSNNNIPIVSVHGRKDRIVPYDHKDAPLYGSYAIHRKADALGIPNRLKTYDDYAHELQKHFNPLWAGNATKKRWLEAGQFAADFLYEQLWK